MTTAWGKKFFYEYVACVCLNFGTIFLAIEFFMSVKFVMGVLTIPFALPADLHKSL